MSDYEAPRGFLKVGELSPEQIHARDLASYGHEQDLYKHIATLSTGAVVILTTFLDKLGSKPHWRALVGLSLGAFAASLLGMVTMQLWSVLHVSRHPDEVPSRGEQWRRGLVLAAGFGGFVIGLVALTVFGIRNV